MDAEGMKGLATLAVLVAGGSAWAWFRYPHQTCQRCGGTGKIRLAGTNRFRDCGKCQAQGERRRG